MIVMSFPRLIGVVAIFLFSFCSFLFFLFFVNPEYLDFSGFLAFYVGLFGWIWSLFFLLGYYFNKKVQLPGAIIEGFIRRSGLLSGFITINAFISQAGWWSIYIALILIVLVILADYLLKNKTLNF